MIKVSTTGMVVSLKTDLRFPIPGQQGHGGRIIHKSAFTSSAIICATFFVVPLALKNATNFLLIIKSPFLYVFSQKNRCIRFTFILHIYFKLFVSLCLMLILNFVLCLKSINLLDHFTDCQRIWDIPSPGNHRTGRDFRRNSSLYKNILSPILCSTLN